MRNIFINTIIVIIIFFGSAKVLDVILLNYYGLGNPLIYQYSNVLGYEIKPNQKTKRLGNKIKINEEGMRSNHQWSKKKHYKLLFFGDSVTYGGSIVSNSDLFTEKICTKLGYLSKNKNKCNVLDLQKKIWGYVEDTETHTVETHIYRLRKKIASKFKDDSFILSHPEGYFIN